MAAFPVPAYLARAAGVTAHFSDVIISRAAVCVTSCVNLVSGYSTSIIKLVIHGRRLLRPYSGSGAL